MASNYNLDENNFDIRISWNSEVEKIFIREKIYTRHPWRVAGTFSRGDVVTIPGAWVPERYASMPRRGFANFGAFTYCMAENISMRVTAGRYCSIAAGVEVMGDSHPVERVSTHLWSYREHMHLLAQQEFGQSILLHPYDAASEVVQLGNDVWIGQEAMIKGGVKIGDGAVVAARSVVTKDVAPYTVVAGVPAKPIRMRFDQPTIDRLIDAQWWQYCFADFGDLDPRQPKRFLDNLAHMLNLGQIKTFSPGYVHMAEILEAELS